MSNTIPEGWSIAPIGDICNIAIGGTPSRSIPDYWDSSKTTGSPWVSIRDLNKPWIHETSEWITEAGIKHSNVKLVRKGTVLMSFKLSVGRVAFAGRDLYTNEAIAAFLPQKKNEYSDQFLYQGLQHWNLLENIDQAVKGVTLNKEKINQIETLLPPLPEQKKIAAILSSVDEVIEKTRAQIDKLKDLKTGMMQELLAKGIGPGGVPHTEFKDSPLGRIPVGWESYLLGDVFDLKNGVNKDKDAFGHGVPIISYKNVYVGGGILDSDLSALVEMNEKELSRFRVHFGDVFFTRTSETPDEIGFSNVYLGRRDDVVFNGFVIRARQKNGLFHPNFLKYVFQSNAVRKQMMDNSKFTTRAGISGESLGRIAIAVPDISEQKNIANALDSVEARITKTINKINAIQSFKKALMQDLLTGKVRVNVDSRELADA